MAGHGSPRPDDRANHPGRQVSPPTRIAQQGTWFERYEGSRRVGLTPSAKGSATLGGPKGTFQDGGISRGVTRTTISR